MSKEDIDKIIAKGKSDAVAGFGAELEALLGGGSKESKELGFDPETELKKIHSGSKEEKRRKLAGFKEKLIEQKKGIAEIQKKLFAEMEKNPDASVEEYLKSVQDLIGIFSLSDGQISSFRKGLEVYSETHEAIKENTKDCIVKETGKIDGPKLYEKLFKRKPEGKVEVILRPAMIYVRTENLDDYAVACSGGAINRITDEVREKADKSGGCLLEDFNMGGLENAIALEKATNGRFDEVLFDKDILKHEEQHVFNRIILHGYDAEQKKIDKKRDQFDKEFGSRSVLEKGVWDKYNEYDSDKKNIEIENLAKDEIVAFFKDGSSPEYISKALLSPGTLYKYGFDYKGGNEEKSEFSQEYVDLVKNGISAYSDLLKAGYAIENVQGLLFVEPLSKWPKVVERIIGEENIPKEQIAGQEVVEDPKEKELTADLEEARNLYAKTELRDVTTMQRIRKLLGVSPQENQENNNVAYARTAYENALRSLKDYNVSKLQNSGLKGEAMKVELKNLFSYFNHDETLKFYDSKTQAKMDYLAETENKSSAKKTWDNVRLKSAQIAEWYDKKVPSYVKLGLAGAAFIPGAQTFALGKRTWGAFMMVAAGGMQIDKIAQFKDNISNKVEGSRVIDRAINSDVNFEYFNAALDEKIAGLDKKLSQHAMRSQVNKFVAFGSAIFLGATTAKGILDMVQGHGIFASAIEHSAPAVTAAEHAAPAAHHEVLTIKDHSSIEKTLIEHIDKNHPGMFKDSGWAAHHMFLDYMTENKDEIIKKVGQVEYDKMYKDGMVNVKAGTGLELVIDEHNKLKLHDISGKISHIGHIEKPAGIIASAGVPVEASTEASIEASAAGLDGAVDSARIETQSQINGLERQREILEKEIPARQQAYDSYRYGDEVRTDGITTVDDDSYADSLKDAKSELESTHSKLHGLLADKGVLDGPDMKTNAISLKNFIFGKSADGEKLFQEMKDRNIFDAFRSEESKKAFLGRFPKGTAAGLEKLIKEVPPKPGDTVRKWIVRTIIEYKKVKA